MNPRAGGRHLKVREWSSTHRKQVLESQVRIRMEWHIINHRDYIDGPFESYEAALNHARALGNDPRVEPRVRRRARDFYVYHPPYDRRERWQAEYWILTKDAALAEGVAEKIFSQPLEEAWL